MTVQKQILGTVGQCIYCGVSEGRLNEEHIVPLSLGGTWVLRKASCCHCQDITSGIELDVLRNALLPVRAKMNLPTRRKDKRPKEFPLTFEREGKQMTVSIPIDKYPTFLALPRFKLPAYVDKRRYQRGIDVDGLYSIVLGQQALGELVKELKADKVVYKVTYGGFKGGFSFARLLAKIAYGFAVSRFGANIVGNAYVLPSILGKSDDVGNWVGCSGESSATTSDLHEINLSIVNDDIYVDIRLFALLPGPQYLVVVGKAPSVCPSCAH